MTVGKRHQDPVDPLTALAERTAAYRRLPPESGQADFHQSRTFRLRPHPDAQADDPGSRYRPFVERDLLRVAAVGRDGAGQVDSLDIVFQNHEGLIIDVMVELDATPVDQGDSY